MCRSSIGGWESLKLEQYICSSTFRILDWKRTVGVKDTWLGHSAVTSTSLFASGKLVVFGYCLLFHLESQFFLYLYLFFWGDIEWNVVPSAILFIEVCHLANYSLWENMRSSAISHFAGMSIVPCLCNFSMQLFPNALQITKHSHITSNFHSSTVY